MAHIVADRVRDTATTTGTGAFTLAGTPPTGYRAVSSVCANADTFWYCIQHQSANEWEVGLGTSNGGTTLTRTTVLASSNGGAAVNFSSGTKDVFATHPATHIGRTITGTTNVITVTNGDGVSGNPTLTTGSLVMRTDTTATVTIGYSVTPNSLTTSTSFTVNPALGNYQYITNNGAFTITNPASDCAVDILVTNGATAGAITARR